MLKSLLSRKFYWPGLDSDPLPIPDRIWSELSIDFTVQSVVLESLKDITAETTARALLRNVVQHHGVPRAIDNWEELLPAAMMAINNHNSTSTGLSPFFITHGLDTPPGIHNVFHTSDDYRPPAILTDDGELWEVEEILDRKKVGREWKVLVKWHWLGMKKFMGKLDRNHPNRNDRNGEEGGVIVTG
ncbi:integrase core domain-containing protein [Hirsutella rhossiliensis]